ncbi:MAG: LPS export ABC transporter permease LptG [Alphaproteobacteria bacterium]
MSLYNPTVNLYIARKYLINMLLLMLMLLGLIYLLDMLELIRRASKIEGVPLSLVFQMGLLKLPEVGQRVIPFAVLFAAMFTFWQLNKRYELIVLRSSGFSVWQFLAPALFVALSVGFLQMALINPMGAIMLSKFKAMERDHFNYDSSQITFFEEGLWLRQNFEDKQGYAVIHAAGFDKENWRLRSVMVLKFDENNGFQERIDARTATLGQGSWLLSDTVRHNAGEPVADRAEEFYLPTNLTIEEIEESFASIDTMSFWNLPGRIKILENTGFDSTRLRMYYRTLWSQPLFYAAMILLAATVSLNPPRQRGTLILVTLGVLIGFAVFFISSFLQALGISRQIPVTMAAWAPAVIAFLIGLSVLMTSEDG